MVFCRSEVDAIAHATVDLLELESGDRLNRASLVQQGETIVRENVTAYIVKARGEMLAKRLQPGSETTTPALKSF